jgi:hypothetical protein
VVHAVCEHLSCSTCLSAPEVGRGNHFRSVVKGVDKKPVSRCLRMTNRWTKSVLESEYPWPKSHCGMTSEIVGERRRKEVGFGVDVIVLAFGSTEKNLVVNCEC